MLNQQWQRTASGVVPSRPFLQLGLSDNVSYTYDESLPEGSRITGVWINGAPIDPAKTYAVGSGASFLIAGGGDNFHELAKGKNPTDTGRADLEAWVSWVKAAGPLTPDYTKRGVSAKLATETVLVRARRRASTPTFGEPDWLAAVAPQTLDMALQRHRRHRRPRRSPTAGIGVRLRRPGRRSAPAPVVDGKASVAVWLPKGTSVAAGKQVIRLEVLESGTEILANDGARTTPRRPLPPAPDFAALPRHQAGPAPAQRSPAGTDHLRALLPDRALPHRDLGHRGVTLVDGKYEVTPRAGRSTT